MGHGLDGSNGFCTDFFFREMIKICTNPFDPSNPCPILNMYRQQTLPSKNKKDLKANIKIQNREMTDSEFKRMKIGFDENSIDNGVAIQQSDRFGFVAVEDKKFIGCSSGLAYKNGEQYSGWFYLTDLFVEKEYRFQKIGKELLGNLEKEIKKKGITQIWTWTAGYEAPRFYQKQGYEIFAEMENWYSDGSSRVGLKKKL